VLANLTAFSQDDKEQIPEVYEHLKTELNNLAIVLCESDPQISQAEFALYMMKFSNNKRIQVYLNFLE